MLNVKSNNILYIPNEFRLNNLKNSLNRSLKYEGFAISTGSERAFCLLGNVPKINGIIVVDNSKSVIQYNYFIYSLFHISKSRQEFTALLESSSFENIKLGLIRERYSKDQIREIRNIFNEFKKNEFEVLLNFKNNVDNKNNHYFYSDAVWRQIKNVIDEGRFYIVSADYRDFRVYQLIKKILVFNKSKLTLADVSNLSSSQFLGAEIKEIFKIFEPEFLEKETVLLETVIDFGPFKSELDYRIQIFNNSVDLSDLLN